jgi:hypothetical protein
MQLSSATPTYRRLPLGLAITPVLFGVLVSAPLRAQRDARGPVTQAFDAAECRGGCTLDTLTVDVERGRRAQPGTLIATFVLVDTIALPRRGAPPALKEKAVGIWIGCDSTPCGAVTLMGRVTDKRVDDARVARRVVATWVLPAPLLSKLKSANAAGVTVDARTHALSATVVRGLRELVQASGPVGANVPYSPRAALYIATYAAIGIPGDSMLAEDVGTATEPLMMPGTTSAVPSRVATLNIIGRGAEALPLLVQDDATGAAPIFGIGENVAILLPSPRGGRRGISAGKVLARQRVEVPRDSCQTMKVWTYLVGLSAADLAGIQRARVASPRQNDAIDRWNGTAVRDPIPARISPTEQRGITAARPVVQQFARELSSTGLRDRDVQVLAVLPKAAGFVTNFGPITRDGGGGWKLPPVTLRPLTCQ